MPSDIFRKPIFAFRDQLVFVLLFLFFTYNVYAQELYPVQLSDKSWHNQTRELRYHPDKTDFVITNGNRLFTRALYGTHSAFRVEAGDRPNFALYMPGMGGNFQFGIINSKGQAKWVSAANKVIARYHPGSMIYSVEDSLLGKGKMEIEILAMADAEGFIIKTHFENTSSPIQLFWAFGGASGKKFSRDGDMGPDPESSYYITPEKCTNNYYTILKDAKFQLKYGELQKQKTLFGIFHQSSVLKIGGASQLNFPSVLTHTETEKYPILLGTDSIKNNIDYYFSIYNPETKNELSYSDLPIVYQQAADARENLSNQIKIQTPDPFINTIGTALSMAADAIWESPTYMHGAIGWRMRLNGWRGPYTADVLGWHDRAKSHLEAYALSQLTSPAIGSIIPDTTMHLSRGTEKLGIGMFSSGYITRDPGGLTPKAHHYDMNLVYIDQLQRHIEWTGDNVFTKKTWPVFKNHLDWETRNFDVDGNGLYDAYAAIWASDALQYSGGDVTHSSAYNYRAYKRAAQIAMMLGENPQPFLQQAKKILDALNNILWIPEKGIYAEYKDKLGNKLLHPSAALWTVYHAIDSDVPDKFQAYQLLRYIDNEIPHIPIKAIGLKDEGYYSLSTSKWMPYMWSLNNVALAESMHTALANWQGGRTDEAFKLFKSEVLASMYMGGSPGNFVQISHYDAIRGEAYRDFADPIGMFSRALVEGLFGIVPDALNKTLFIRPGLPAAWDKASFETPDIRFEFKRIGKIDSYHLHLGFPIKMNLRMQVIAQGQVDRVIVNGKTVVWENVTDAVGKPIIEIKVRYANNYDIQFLWKNAKPILPPSESVISKGEILSINFENAKITKIYDPQKTLVKSTINNGLSGEIHASEGNHSLFVQLLQGELSWWMPICFRVVPSISLETKLGLMENNSKFNLINNTDRKKTLLLEVNNFSTIVPIESKKNSREIVVPETSLIPGTNQIKLTDDSGKNVVADLINWEGKKTFKQETIDLSNYYNDKVTQIFKNKYLSPRPMATTLQLPWQGIGDWPHPLATADIDDKGLRALAGVNNLIRLPQGILFKSPSESSKDNILFTSQWENYPKEKTIELTGKASHAWLLMAGSTNPMQSQLDNGELLVEYSDGSSQKLVLHNPETWWPIEQDYYTDGFAFSLKQVRPLRIHLKTGKVVDAKESQVQFNGHTIEGGAATVLDIPLDISKTLKGITLRTLSNDVVIGLMSLTLARD